MPPTPADLPGSAPDTAAGALLLVDVINPLDFPERDQLLEEFSPMSKRLAKAADAARAAGVPVVYANDNFGRWRSDFRAVADRCAQAGGPVAEIARRLHPAEGDYFVLKPKHSAFFSTSLDLLLRHLGTRTLVVAGVAGNICVLFTANDAYMRGYELLVPADGVASNTRSENDAALDQARRVLKAQTPRLADIPWADLARRSESP